MAVKTQEKLVARLGFSPELALSALAQLGPGQSGCSKVRISSIPGLEFDQAFVEVINGNENLP